MNLKSRLLMHAPPQVQTDWAIINNVHPAEEWPEKGPSVELGLKMLRGKDAIQARHLISKFTNPELLDEIARTDTRVKVAAALVENGNMTVEGYKAVNNRHGHHPWVRQAFFNAEAMPLRLHEVEELGLPAPRMGIENDARAVGLRGAFDIAAQCRSSVVQDLMSAYIGEPKFYTPKASHAEILDLFEHYYQSEFSRQLGGPVMPTGKERWIVEVPGAYERILHAITACDFDVRYSNIELFIRNMPDEVQGEVPDVRILAERAVRDADYWANEILTAWFAKRPASPAELEKFKDIVDQHHRIPLPRLWVTPETLLAADPTLVQRLGVVNPIEAAWTALTHEDDTPAEQRIRDATKLLVNSDVDVTIRQLNEVGIRPGSWFRHSMGDVSINSADLLRDIADKYAEFLNPELKSTSEILNELTEKHGLWGRMLERDAFRRLAIKSFTTSLTLHGVPRVRANWLLTPDMDREVRVQVMKAIRDRQLDDRMWREAAEYLLSSVNSPTEVLIEVEQADHKRFLDLLVKPTLMPPQDARASHRWRERQQLNLMAEQYLSVAMDSAIANYEQGDNSKIDALFSLLNVWKPDPLSEYRITKKVILTERGLMSGMCTARQALAHSESYETIAKILTDRFGDDPVRWQLAVELLEEWDGTLPSLLEVVEATG